MQRRFNSAVRTRARLAAALLCAAGGLQAAEFDTSFEVPASEDRTTADTFVIDDGTLSATFAGGTVFTAGIFTLYNTGAKSWMVDPDGVRGSNGTGTATLSEDAIEITLFGRNQGAGVTSRVRVLDDAGGVISETNLTHTQWTEITVTRNPGDSPIGSVVVENMSGGTTTNLMVAIDDFGFETTADTSDSDTDEPDTDDDSESSDTLALGPALLAILPLAAALRRRRR